MKRYIIPTLAVIFLAGTASAQPQRFSGEEWNDKSVGSLETAPKRTEFISFDTRQSAENGKRTDSPFYKSLPADSLSGVHAATGIKLDIPFMWLDREVFLHIEGVDPCYILINGRTIAYLGDSRTPAEFNISSWITDGANTLKLTFPDDASGKKLENPQPLGRKPDIYIYSQPKIRVENFLIKAGFDTTGKNCILDVTAVVSNSYNSEESFRLGYDIYTPDSKTLVYYDMRDVTLEGQRIDTVRFTEPISVDMKKNLWSAENPVLYRFMLNISYDKRWIEYIPVKVGFGETTFKDGTIYRNGKPIEMKILKGFNTVDFSDLGKELRRLKKEGYNTIWPAYPQPLKFYDLCEEIGLYVIEQVNLNFRHNPEDRTVGGTYSNDPQWLGTFIDRTAAAYARVANRPCVIAWSLGGDVGNGYNMYKTYQWLKSREDTRPVIFNGAEDEWNSDMPRITF